MTADPRSDLHDRPDPADPYGQNGRDGVLVLADGSLFEGELFGASVPTAGEVVFNTALSGYQEVLTDPSYAGQIITFTNPHIGNYGVNVTDFESRRPFCRGVVVRELARRASNRRSEGDLDSMLAAYGIPGITGIDTRRLARLIRDTGAIPGAFGPVAELDSLQVAAVSERGTEGVDLVAQVTTPEPYTVAGDGPFRIVAYDLGIKRSILRRLAGFGTVEVVPASTSAADVLARRPDGVFLSNGPGDPAEIPATVAALGDLLGEVPVFGICLGHQVLGRAVGGETVKLPFGHHGANHPVQEIATGTIEITSQNHNFAVAADSLPAGVTVTHVNLNDGVCEGLAVEGADAWSVQHHPEAAPGPHDSRHLFARFATAMALRRGIAEVLPAGHDGDPAGLPQPERGVA